MKQSDSAEALWRTKGGSETLSDYIWETFDSLFKTVYRQGRRVEELEARVVDLERRLQERAAALSASQAKATQTSVLGEMPAERAA